MATKVESSLRLNTHHERLGFMPPYDRLHFQQLLQYALDTTVCFNEFVVAKQTGRIEEAARAKADCHSNAPSEETAQ